MYLKEDYDHGYSWVNDFTDGLHLPGGANDSDATDRTLDMLQGTDASGRETWTAYLPEYDNLTDTTACSLIQVKINGEEHLIHFSDYSDGTTDSPADYDIHRNYLYRFVVTDYMKNFIVTPQIWENAFDSEFNY